MKLAYGQLTYILDAQDAIENVKLVKPYVDGCIVIYEETLQNTDYVNILKKLEVTTKFMHWGEDESVVEARNLYLNTARELGYNWLIWSDPDEHFSKYTLGNIKTAIEYAENQGWNCLDMNVRDVYLDGPNGEPISEFKEEPSNFWKTLVVKLDSDIYIGGAGVSGNRHEINKGTVKLGKLPKNYYYTHRRSRKEIWEKAMRNFFVTGGGDGFGYTNPMFVEFKGITNELNIHLWVNLRKYMIAGNIDERLKDFLIRHRNDYDEKWKEELRDAFRWYFYVIHPEENINKLVVAPHPVIKRSYAEQVVWDGYLKILQREADDSGYKFYVSLINNGQLNKEQFEAILYGSDEHKNKVSV